MRITDNMLTSAQAEAEVEFSRAPWHTPINDAAARTIAGWWAGPDLISMPMTRLSQGTEVSKREVVESIDFIEAQHLASMATVDKHALAALRQWVNEQPDNEPSVTDEPRWGADLSAGEWLSLVGLLPEWVNV